MTYDQVWWPHTRNLCSAFTHPKCTHTPWTHTRSSGQPFMLRCPGSSWGFGALLKSTSVVVLMVKRALYIHSLHLQSLPARDSNSQPFDYESESLTIRPRFPLMKLEDEHFSDFLFYQLSYILVLLYTLLLCYLFILIFICFGNFVMCFCHLKKKILFSVFIFSTSTFFLAIKKSVNIAMILNAFYLPIKFPIKRVIIY